MLSRSVGLVVCRGVPKGALGACFSCMPPAAQGGDLAARLQPIAPLSVLLQAPAPAATVAVGPAAYDSRTAQLAAHGGATSASWVRMGGAHGVAAALRQQQELGRLLPEHKKETKKGEEEFPGTEKPALEVSSVIKKRRKKMNKHKLRKRRRLHRHKKKARYN